MRRDEEALTSKPEGVDFGRGGGKNGLWRSVEVAVGDSDLNSRGRSEVLWGK